MSREAKAALSGRLGCLKALLQSRARAYVPTDLATSRYWSISVSLSLFAKCLQLAPGANSSSGAHTSFSMFSTANGTSGSSSLRLRSTRLSSWAAMAAAASLSSCSFMAPLRPLCRAGTSAWYLEPTRISPWSATRLFWYGS